jgi:hypothetical protein
MKWKLDGMNVVGGSMDGWEKEANRTGTGTEPQKPLPPEEGGCPQVVPQPRDRAVLAALGRFGPLGSAALGATLLAGTGPRRVRQVLDRLRRAGWVRAVPVPTLAPGRRYTWWPTGPGWRAADLAGDRPPPLPRRLGETLAHREAVYLAAWVLSEGDLARWRPEREERRAAARRGQAPGAERHFPDGVLDGTLAVEVELSPKARPRLRAILGRYARSGAYPAVLWLCAPGAVARRVRETVAAAVPPGGDVVSRLLGSAGPRHTVQDVADFLALARDPEAADRLRTLRPGALAR